ncbi:MAG: ATP-dependent Clp protease ATP-binding subunit [Candidatus Sungbacteria bacterium]|nr:ATP-dependent Clp protease ATP-binding subunit [Candidatus Sungbacteria bacterium]
MSTIQFPKHPFFIAARIERLIPLRRIAHPRNAVAAAIIFILGVYLVSGHPALLGFLLLMLATFLFFYLWSQFIRMYAGRGLAILSGDFESAGDAMAPDEWPYYLAFSSATILSGINDHDDTEELIRNFLERGFGKFLFGRLGIERTEFLLELKSKHKETGHEFRINFLELIKEAARAALKNGHSFITPADILSAIGFLDKTFLQILIAREVAPKDFDYAMHWFDIAEEHGKHRTFLERLESSPGIGKEWAFGYSPFLDRRSREITVRSGEELHILAHKKEISALEEALSKDSTANAVLIGEPGVGKMTIVKGLARKIGEGKSVPVLNYRRVRKLAMEDILTEKTVGGIEETLGRIFRDAEIAGNVILVIEDIEQYITPGLATNLMELLLPFLRSSRIKIIGLASDSGYAKSVAEHPVIGTLFHEIKIGEPDEEAVILILEDTALFLERKYKRNILYPAIKKIYELASRLITDAPFPEKGISILEEVFASARSSGEYGSIAADVVERLFERKFGAKIGEVGAPEKETLVDLENRLHRRVVNQEEAIRAISDAIRRKRTGISAGSKPAGSFLFLGPTGVGKTETAKALAEAYFGAEERMIRFDMSEYQAPDDLGRLIGSLESRSAGILAEKVRANPFSLLLLDEVEKAHPNILNLFLQILDEGRATDAYGKKIDFTNTIIIATSNAGAELIRRLLNEKVPYAEIKKQLLDEVFRSRVFSPEFINRFDGVIVYVPLGRREVRMIAELMLGALKKRLEGEGYGLQWGEELLDWLAEKGYSEVFGGRELRRVIQERIESQIAKDILAGKYKKGELIKLSPL